MINARLSVIGAIFLLAGGTWTSGELVAGAKAAQAPRVRIAQQPGLGSLPIMVLAQQRFVEKRAKTAGLGEVSVTVATFSGGAATNDALLSGQVDFAVGGVPSLAILWDKTAGAGSVRAAANLTNMPIVLNTVDPKIKTIRDYLTSPYKIAVPAIKTSIQAIVLQMAAEKEFGAGKRNMLDSLTVSANPADASVAMLSGGEIKSNFTNPPFNFLEKKRSGQVRTILTSYDVMGGEHTAVVLYTTAKWKQDNPRLYHAVIAALEDAMSYIQANRKEAAAIYIQATNSRIPASDIAEMLQAPNLLRYTLAPSRVMAQVDFLHEIGMIRKKPGNWKDLFWENMQDQPGT